MEKRKKMIGVVVSDKMDKTVVVEVEKFIEHPKYKKYMKVKKRYKAHDEYEKCEVGDRVLLMEVRPISKEKRWIVKSILGKETVPILEKEIEDDTGSFET